MTKRRWLVVFFLLLVVLSITASVFIYMRRSNIKSDLTIELLNPPKHVTTPTITLKGHVSHLAAIHVTRATSFLGTINADGDFKFEVELEPGWNTIKFSAQTFDFNPLLAETASAINWEPKNPPTPIINPAPATTNLPTLTITGRSYPDAQVTVIVVPDLADIAKSSLSGSRRPVAQDKSQRAKSPPANAQKAPIVKNESADTDGVFKVKVRLPDPGPYRVTAMARNSIGVESAESPEIRFVYDPEWYPSSAPEKSPVVNRIIRKADIVLAHKQMTITLEATLPRDDSAVRSLLANQTSLDDFLYEIFGLEINGTHYRGEFDDVVPRIVIKDRDATISATTTSFTKVRDYLPLLHGELTFAGKDDFPFSNPDDSLSIHTSDYRIEAVSPAPTIFERNTLTWGGSKTPLFDDPFRKVKFQLAYQPFASPRNFLRLAQLSPYAFWRYPGNELPRLLSGLCSLIPMLWVLWLIVDSPIKRIIDANLRNDSSRLSKTLITFSLVSTVFSVSWGLAYLGYEFRLIRRIGSSSDPLLLALASLGVLLLALGGQLIAYLWSRRTWAIWLARIVKGVRNAALICLLIIATTFLGFNQYVARAVSFTVIFAVFTLLFVRTNEVLKQAKLAPKYERRLKRLTFVVFIAFLFPVITPSATFDAQSTISQLSSVLRDFLPYVVVIGLLIILKKVDTLGRRRTQLFILCIGLIFFSAYLVGSTANVFMIPLPFILSIWIFKNFLIHDSRTRADLDSVNNEVVTKRRSLIERVLAHETAQQFQADLQKFKDKVSSGDVTLEDYEDRKLEIEQYAHQKQAASKHGNGLNAKRTVLSIGPSINDWENGRWGAKWGARLIAPFLAAYLLLLLLRATPSLSPAMRFLDAINQVMSFVGDWLIAAFFFGYYFRYLRGDSGLEKGLRTACAVIICLLPAWATHISNKTDLLGVFFRAGQTFLFFTLLGMGAFDYKTFRAALRDQFRWKTFARFGDMPSFTAVLSVLVTSVGVGLTTVLTGQFRQLLSNLISAAFQQAPGPPP